MTRKPALAIAALCTAALAAPAAQAAPAKAPIYEMTLSGSEALAWQYTAPGDGHCFHGAVGNGSQEVTYGTKKMKVKAVKPKSGDRRGFVQFVPVKDRLTEQGFVVGVDGVVKVEREGEITQSAGCGGTGGGSTEPAPKDCGTRYGRINLKPGFVGPSVFNVSGTIDNFGRPVEGEADDLLVPIVPPTSGDALGNTYDNCPFLVPSGVSGHDDITDVGHRISVTRLPRKGKTLRFSGGDQVEFADEDGERTAQTSVAWNMKLKRVK